MNHESNVLQMGTLPYERLLTPKTVGWNFMLRPCQPEASCRSLLFAWLQTAGIFPQTGGCGGISRVRIIWGLRNVVDSLHFVRGWAARGGRLRSFIIRGVRWLQRFGQRRVNFFGAKCSCARRWLARCGFFPAIPCELDGGDCWQTCT